jgi:hypothetical protein
VAEILLDLAEVDAGFQEMGGVAVAQRVSRLLINSVAAGSATASILTLIARWMSFALSGARESPA